jgi:hypothetical protein
MTATSAISFMTSGEASGTLAPMERERGLGECDRPVGFAQKTADQAGINFFNSCGSGLNDAAGERKRPQT